MRLRGLGRLVRVGGVSRWFEPGCRRAVCMYVYVFLLISPMDCLGVLNPVYPYLSRNAFRRLFDSQVGKTSCRTRRRT